MRKVLIVLALMLLVASPAFAFDIGGYVGPVVIQFVDYTVGRQYAYDTGTNTWVNQDTAGRSGLPAGGSDLVNGTNYGSAPLDTVEDSWGIIQIQTITDPNHHVLWVSGQNGEYVKGVVYGYNDVYINSLNGTQQEVGQIGGGMDLYLSNTDFTAASLANPTNRSTIESLISVGNTPFTQLVATTGVVGGTNWTRDETTNGLTAPFSGSGSGYFNVVEGWGSYDWLLDGNYNGFSGNPTADVYAKFSFDSDTSTNPNQHLYDAFSSDPAYATTIPEPASMVLLGIGLVGAALRRKKA